MNLPSHIHQKSSWRVWVLPGAALILSSLPLALISNNLNNLRNWPSFLLLEVVSAGLIALVWRLLRVESPPRWLLNLTIIAAIAHLALGIVWMEVLPRWGHGSQAERDGYVMGDAFARDTLAWRLARSEKPLVSAFVDNRKVDQYGGFLFMSAGIYRYLAPTRHHPILVLILAAVISALAIPLTWAFAKLAWGEQTAWLAAWILALYPEAVLMGTSQMREAFTVALAMASLYGLMRYMRDRTWIGLAWILAPVALCLPFSPPMAAMILGLVILLAGGLRFSEGGAAGGHKRLWLILAGLAVVILVGLYLVMRQFTPAKITNPVEMVYWWLTKSAYLQGLTSKHASGWLQKLFKNYPEWAKLPALLGYGVVQPFLPAALVAGSEALVWKIIAIWRSVGWTLLLALLVYAPFLTGRARERRGFNRMVALAVWIVILTAAFRAGGDMWDNPRYRAAFAGLQAALAAWAWVEHRRLADPLLRRAVLALAAILGWFIPWYLRRYYGIDWPVSDPGKTLSLGFVTALLLILWDWVRTAARPASAAQAAVPGSVEANPTTDGGMK